MQAEKSLCACSVRELEARLLDVQDRLMQKVREVAAAREVQTSLRTEIESYKALIECQEKKYVPVSFSFCLGCLGSAVVGRPTRDRKVAGSTPGRGAYQVN